MPTKTEATPLAAEVLRLLREQPENAKRYILVNSWNGVRRIMGCPRWPSGKSMMKEDVESIEEHLVRGENDRGTTVLTVPGSVHHRRLLESEGDNEVCKDHC